MIPNVGLLQAVLDWPDDGRPYVVLGRLLAKQGRTGAARSVYEQGCQALGGDNAYIWQVSSGALVAGIIGAGTTRGMHSSTSGSNSECGKLCGRPWEETIPAFGRCSQGHWWQES